jgi:hypothetical protein
MSQSNCKLSDLKLATMSRVLPDNAAGVFKDSYLLDFLDLPETHSEADLQAGLGWQIPLVSCRRKPCEDDSLYSRPHASMILLALSRVL